MYTQAIANPRRRRNSRKRNKCACEGGSASYGDNLSGHSGLSGYNQENAIDFRNISKPAKIGIAVGGGAAVLGLVLWLVFRGDKPSDVAYKGVAIHLKPIFVGGAAKWTADFQWTPPGPGAKTKQISAIGSSSSDALDNAQRMIDDFVNAVT